MLLLTDIFFCIKNISQKKNSVKDYLVDCKTCSVKKASMLTLKLEKSAEMMLQLCGCFAASGSAALKKVNGIMKEEDHLQILQEALKLSSEYWVLGAGVPTGQLSKTHISVKLLNQAGTEVLEWSSQSPDLNPIGNMWTVSVKKQVCASTTTDLVELHRFCQEEWLSIPEACGWFQKHLTEVKKWPRDVEPNIRFTVLRIPCRSFKENVFHFIPCWMQI